MSACGGAYSPEVRRKYFISGPQWAAAYNGSALFHAPTRPAIGFEDVIRKYSEIGIQYWCTHDTDVIATSELGGPQQAEILGRIKAAYDREPTLANLLLDPSFREELGARQNGWRNTIAGAAQAGMALSTMGGSLAYYDMVRRERLPANLTQAQRDYFGAHTYARIDKPGVFHTEWAEGS